MAFGQAIFEGKAGQNEKPITGHQSKGAEVIPFPKIEMEPRKVAHQLALELHRKMELAASLDVMLRLAEQEGIALEGDMAERIQIAGSDATALYQMQQELRLVLGEDRYHRALHQATEHVLFLGSQTLKWLNEQKGV